MIWKVLVFAVWCGVGGWVLWGRKMLPATAESQAANQTNQTFHGPVHYGDKVSGDKIAGDKVAGDKIIQHNGPVNIIPQRDLIPGTDYTHEDMRKNFRFGYLIISKRDGHWTFEPRPEDGLLVWDMDLMKKKIQIEPDFSARTVTWTLPDMSATKSGGATNLKEVVLKANSVRNTYPMRTDTFYTFSPFRISDGDPEPLIGMLSDDQLFPVFVIGMRILERPPRQIPQANQN